VTGGTVPAGHRTDPAVLPPEGQDARTVPGGRAPRQCAAHPDGNASSPTAVVRCGGWPGARAGVRTRLWPGSDARVSWSAVPRETWALLPFAVHLGARRSAETAGAGGPARRQAGWPVPSREGRTSRHDHLAGLREGL